MKKLIMVMAMLFLFPVQGHNQEYKFKYGKETIKLTSQILKFEEKCKYKLEYKSIDDLQESVDIIIQQAKYSRFDKYDIASTVIAESRFKQYATSKVGAVGLGQLYKIHKFYNEELFWVNNPYDKHQNIIASIIIMEDKLDSYKTKHMARIRYNGKVCNDSIFYANKIKKIKNELIRS